MLSQLETTALAAARKAYHSGTHRTVAPEETLKRITPLLPAMGITRVANVTGLDRVGIPVVMVTRPNSRSVSVSQGKGTTLTAAKVSGIMEAIEGYHAERVTLPLKFASFEELRYTHQMVNVYALPRTGRSTFTPDAPLLWTEGKSLVSGHSVWVPFEMVHLNYTAPMPSGTGCFLASSNGLSSGNTLDEAISHGISELVERDAATLWHRLDAEARAHPRRPRHHRRRLVLRPHQALRCRRHRHRHLGHHVRHRLAGIPVPRRAARCHRAWLPPRCRHGLPPGARDRAVTLPHRGGAEPSYLHLRCAR